MERWHWLMALLIWLGCFLTFYRIGKLKALQRLYQKTKSGMEEAARRRLLLSRENLSKLRKEEGFWLTLERQLCYAGLRRRFPFLNAEVFALLTLLAGLGCFVVGMALSGLLGGLMGIAILLGAEFLVIMLGKASETHAVNENLMKMLDFLGNYSVTAGDVTAVLGQISKFLEEPLQSALDQCCVEAQTTGDVGLALLTLADKIEHPQFKELIRNVEVSSRHSADFSVLVSYSRRSVREYLKSCRERKSLLREAGINMALLLGMSVFSLVTVNGLLEVSIWSILFQTVPGWIALGVVAGIVLLFAMQVYRLET